MRNVQDIVDDGEKFYTVPEQLLADAFTCQQLGWIRTRDDEKKHNQNSDKLTGAVDGDFNIRTGKNQRRNKEAN